MTEDRAHLEIKGRVQGVGFRASTRRMARKFSLTGWVKNKPDGTVEAVVEGEKENVKKLISWARQGPRLANVTDVEIDWEDPKSEFEGFSIRY